MARVGYWLATHDPVSIVTRRLIPHRGLLGWATLLLLPLLLYIDWRTTLITLWAVIGAGLLVSVVLTEHGEGIQRRVWVRDNAELINGYVAFVIACVGEVGLVGAGVDADVRQRLLHGETRARRHQGALSALQAINHFASAQPPPLAQLSLRYEPLHEQVTMLMHFMDDRLRTLNRLTELFGALYQWRGEALTLLSSLPTAQWGGQAPGDLFLRTSGTQRTADDAVTRERRRDNIADLADATVDVCARCADILLDAGLLEA